MTDTNSNDQPYQLDGDLQDALRDAKSMAAFLQMQFNGASDISLCVEAQSGAWQCLQKITDAIDVVLEQGTLKS